MTASMLCCVSSRTCVTVMSCLTASLCVALVSCASAGRESVTKASATGSAKRRRRILYVCRGRMEALEPPRVLASDIDVDARRGTPWNRIGMEVSRPVLDEHRHMARSHRLEFCHGRPQDIVPRDVERRADAGQRATNTVARFRKQRRHPEGVTDPEFDVCLLGDERVHDGRRLLHRVDLGLGEYSRYRRIGTLRCHAFGAEVLDPRIRNGQPRDE